MSSTTNGEDTLHHELHSRTEKLLKRLIENATEADLRELLEAETGTEFLARLLAQHVSGGEPSKGVSPEIVAQVRGIAVKRRLAFDAGGLLQAGRAAELLEISPDEVEQRRQCDRLLGVPVGDGYLYPACQFTGTGVVGGLADALDAFQDVESPWTRLSVLLSGADTLGETVMSALRSGRRGEALAEIRRFGRT